ncbi:hypothetical protein GP486_007031 [Trichoglossum hirsutum]|uniref:Uncharacterized protein n=1 Tax=Trichoglossum hirsutum TaxID=265104 RepID=A0A9P8II09_9PEZI|nr:hypothetical protein GP486_007031 [Trichoglossum hirsutum]
MALFAGTNALSASHSTTTNPSLITPLVFSPPISTDMSSAPSSTLATQVKSPGSITSSSTLQQASSQGGLRYPSNRKTIYDRNLNRSRNAELSRASFAYLFGEMVSYAQRRVTGIQDLEKRYRAAAPEQTKCEMRRVGGGR